MIEVRIDDVAFNESPDAGDPECRCSRCLQPIKESESPLRCFTESRPVKEYRYCTSCMAGMGFQVFNSVNEDEMLTEEDFPEGFFDDL